MAGIIKKKYLTGTTRQTSNQTDVQNQTSTSNSYSNSVSNSNGLSWNTSHVSNGTQRALQKAEKRFNSPYEHQLNSTLGQINNRKKFEYDLNEDALYQQYANKYKALGQQAMQDTVGSAATLSGGYGNSYAVTAGQQAYNSYLQQLNDIVPTLYQQARSNYDTETQNLYNKAGLYQGLDSEAYQRYSNDRSYYSDKYNNEWNRSAVSHSKQTDTSSQTSRETSNTNSYSNSTNTSINSTYAKPTYAKPTIKLPTASETGSAAGKYETAKGLMASYGLSGTDKLKSWYKWKADKKKENKKNNKKEDITYGKYKTYLADAINNGIKKTYGSNENKNTSKNKNKKK